LIMPESYTIRRRAGIPAYGNRNPSRLFMTVALALAGPAMAGDWEDAVEAYKRQDYATALRLLKPLADQGYARAQDGLGIMYRDGEGVSKDYAQALKWLQLAADQGNAGAQRSLGIMYRDGEGVPKDYAQALKWLRLAADQGLVYSQLACGYMYAVGQGVPKDEVLATQWFRKAADQGNETAQGTLVEII
jgi:TPR repeat protein